MNAWNRQETLIGKRGDAMRLTLGQAAKTAGRSKGTLSKALNSGRMTGSKGESGRWEIDPAELSRWMQAHPLPKRAEDRKGPLQETPADGVAVEAGMLREQLERLAAERDRERGQLMDQIEDLRRRLDGAEAERAKLNAVLTDQRGRRAPWARLFG